MNVGGGSPRRDGAFRPVRQGDSAPLPVRARRPRLESFDYTGEYAYHVTVRTHRSIPAFDNPVTARGVIEVLKGSADHTAFFLHAYCLMPDHLHILCQGAKTDSDLKAFVHRFKQLTSFSHKKATGHVLWQASYFDRVLRRDESLQTVADYIFQNPVSAGLVDDARYYELSGGLYATRSHADGPEGTVPTNVQNYKEPRL